MKSRIILILAGILFSLLLAFQTYRIGIIKKENNRLKSQVNSLINSININNADLAKRNEELEEAKKKTEDLRKKANEIHNVCLHTTVNLDFLDLLHSE